jgi:hypothetical protein
VARLEFKLSDGSRESVTDADAGVSELDDFLNRRRRFSGEWLLVDVAIHSPIAHYVAREHIISVKIKLD